MCGGKHLLGFRKNATDALREAALAMEEQEKMSFELEEQTWSLQEQSSSSQTSSRKLPGEAVRLTFLYGCSINSSETDGLKLISSSQLCF